MDYDCWYRDNWGFRASKGGQGLGVDLGHSKGGASLMEQLLVQDFGVRAKPIGLRLNHFGLRVKF